MIDPRGRPRIWMFESACEFGYSGEARSGSSWYLSSNTHNQRSRDRLVTQHVKSITENKRCSRKALFLGVLGHSSSLACRRHTFTPFHMLRPSVSRLPKPGSAQTVKPLKPSRSGVCSDEPLCLVNIAGSCTTSGHQPSVISDAPRSRQAPIRASLFRKFFQNGSLLRSFTLSFNGLSWGSVTMQWLGFCES